MTSAFIITGLLYQEWFQNLELIIEVNIIDDYELSI